MGVLTERLECVFSPSPPSHALLALHCPLRGHTKAAGPGSSGPAQVNSGSPRGRPVVNTYSAGVVSWGQYQDEGEDGQTPVRSGKAYCALSFGG